MYLGIDIGTSSVKVVLLNELQELTAQANAALSLSHPQPLWSEQNPQDWWQATCDAMAQLRTSHPQQLAQVKAIGLSGQMHGATLLDSRQNILRPAILWNDGRCMSECEQLEQQVPEFAAITGNRVMPGFTAPKLLWVAKHEPEIFKKIAKVLLPKDYIRLLMTQENASDMSDASGTMWLDVGKRQWSETMLAATGLSEQHMPKLFEGSEITCGVTMEIAEKWGIPKNTLVAAGGGDNAAAAISVNVIKPGSAFLSLGTSGVYFVANQKFQANPEGGVHTFCHCLPKLWQQMTVHLSAASCLSWLSNVLKVKESELLEEAAQTPASHDQVIFLPYLSGERTPHADSYARGVFFGLSHSTQRADLTKAVLEGVAFAFADGQNEMIKAGIPIQEVSVVGGGARSLYWGKILATALNRPLIYRHNREAGAAAGAALLAWLAVNKHDPLTAFSTPETEAIIEPDSRLLKNYEKKYSIFKELYQNLKAIYKKNF